MARISSIVPLTDLERRMLEVLTRRERFVMEDMKQATGCDQEQLLALYEPLFDRGPALLCLNISGGRNWFEITPHGRQALRTADDDERS